MPGLLMQGLAGNAAPPPVLVLALQVSGWVLLTNLVCTWWSQWASTKVFSFSIVGMGLGFKHVVWVAGEVAWARLLQSRYDYDIDFHVFKSLEFVWSQRFDYLITSHFLWRF